MVEILLAVGSLDSGCCRPGAAYRHPIRIAAVWVRRHAIRPRSTWVGLPAVLIPLLSVSCYFAFLRSFCVEIVNMKNMLSGVPMLHSRHVALKHS